VHTVTCFSSSDFLLGEQTQPASIMGKKRKTTNAAATVDDDDKSHQDDSVICALSLDDITTGSNTLENILSLLNTPTLKSARLVSKKWDEAALRLLSKRTHLNIATFYESLYRKEEQLIPRAGRYSSWQLTVEKGKNQFPSIYGANVKSCQSLTSTSAKPA
jgi:hypothetical protein